MPRYLIIKDAHPVSIVSTSDDEDTAFEIAKKFAKSNPGFYFSVLEPIVRIAFYDNNKTPI